MSYLKEKTGFDISNPFGSIVTVVEKATSTIKDILGGIVKDPLPTILQTVASAYGIPPYVTSATITAIKGGSIQDVALSAAVSYVSSELLPKTDIGKSVSDFTKTAGQDFTAGMMKTFDLPADMAVSVAKAATAGLNSSIIGGVTAVVTGENVGKAMTSGFTSGAVYSGTDSYFNSLKLNPSWGVGPKALDLMKGSASTALNTLISGKGDPAQAVGNYIAYATLEMGKSEVTNKFKEKFDIYSTAERDAIKQQDARKVVADLYNDGLKDAEKIRTDATKLMEDYDYGVKTIYEPYIEKVNKLNTDVTDYKKDYDYYVKEVEKANAYVQPTYEAWNFGGIVYEYYEDTTWYGNITFMNSRPVQLPDFYTTEPDPAYSTKAQVIDKVKALEPGIQTKGDALNTAYANITKDTAAIDGLKTLKTSIETKTAEYDKAKANLETPTGDNLAARLLAQDKELEKAYEVLGTAKTGADTASENFNKAVADVATRNATIDAVNAGTITVKGVEADGSYKLSNNTFLKDGKFYQDGEQLFTNAGGTKQNDLSFTDSTGNKVVYDSSAGRTMSTSDVKQAFARDFGFDVDDATAAAFVGKQYGTVDHKLYEDVVDNKITTAHTALTGNTLSAADLASIKNSTGSAISNKDGAAVKLTDDEVNKLLAKQFIFEGGDFNTKQDAARAAKLAGYTQFEYDNSIYTMTSAGPTEKDVYQAVIDSAPNKSAAFKAARSFFGTDQVFEYKGNKFTTITADEQNARAQTAAYNDPSRALDNFYSGNVRYSGYDVEGDIAGKTRLSAPAKTILDQLIATGAAGFGEQLETFAAGVSLASGSSFQNTVSNLGKYLVQYGKDASGLDVPRQSENLQKQWKDADKLSFFDQPGAIVKAIKENPLGFISELGKEGFQEGLPLIVGAIAGGTALAFGAPIATGATIVAGTSALLNGWESFGSGGKEAYDLAIKEGALENEAREKGVINGSIHAAITIPLEFIGDKAIIGNYFRGAKGSLIEYAKKFGSTIAVNAATEFIETVPQSLTTRASVIGWDNLTEKDVLSATAGGFAAASIGAGVATGAITPAAINETIAIAKDYSGNDVSYGDFVSGKKTADLSTLKADAVLGVDSSGKNVTFGDAVVTNDYVKIDPTFLNDFLPASFVDPLLTDNAEARQIAQNLGYVNPSQEVLNSLTGPINEADAQAKLSDFLQSMSAFEAGKPISAADAQEMVKDLGLTTMSDADAISLATKIVQSVPTDKLAPDPNIQLAKNAGFPDVATYTQYGGDIGAYNTAQTAAANLATAKAAGFTDYENYNLYKGDINAFNTANENAANLTTAKAAGFPDYAAYTQYKGDVTAYNNAITAAANAQKATDAGFPDYATYTQYNGNKAVYTAALSDASNTALATKAGFPDFNTYTLYGGNKNAYNTALTDTANTQKATTAGFPNYAAYTQYNGDVKAYNTDSAAKIAGWKDAADQTKANTAGYTDPAAYATYLTNTANTQKATTAGFPDYGTYTQFNGDLTAYNSSKLAAETTKAINNAIAGIQFPAGITAADVAAQVKAALDANPNLTVADVTGSITAYMTANPGLSAADVNTAIAAATKDLATKKNIEDAIAGINFPAGLSKADVAAEIKTAMDANPGLSAADVTSAITTYMEANPGLSAADVSAAIGTATKDLATNASMKTALEGVTADVKNKFDTLTQGQKDIVAAQTKQGVDINKAIDDAAKTTSEQITNVRTDLTKDITNVQTQFNARVDELVLQGRTYQEATQEALKELGTGVSGLQTNVADIKKQQDAEAKAKKAAEDKAKTQGGLSAAMALIAPAASAVADDTPYRQIGLKTTGDSKFEGPLEQYLKMVREGDYSPKPKQQDAPQQNQQVAPVQDELSTPQPQPKEGSDYFNYGQQTDINDLLGGGKASELPFKAGGLATPLFAGGGTTRYGHYAGGGLNVIHHSGKPRLDFRTGNAVTGPGDGQSDDIPAMLADGEFVFPADVVAALGNGSTKAGSDKLYDMMHSIRSYHRSAKPKDLPPPAKKSPLDYLKKRTARR